MARHIGLLAGFGTRFGVLAYKVVSVDAFKQAML